MDIDSLDNENFHPTRIRSDIAYIGFFLGITIALVFANFWYVSHHDGYDRSYISYTGELRILSQSIAKNANEAIDGNLSAFELLKQRRNDFDNYLNILKRGAIDTDEIDYLPPTPEYIQEVELAALESVWFDIKQRTDTLLVNQGILLSLYETLGRLLQSLPVLQDKYTEVIQILVKHNYPAKQIEIATTQLFLAERIARDLDEIAKGKTDAESIAKHFSTNAKKFSAVLEGMLNGNNEMGVVKIELEEVSQLLNEISELFYPVQQRIEQIVRTAPSLSHVRTAAYEIFVGSHDLLDKTTELKNTYAAASGKRFINTTTGYILSIICLLNLVVLGVRSYKNAKRDLEFTAEQKALNERDISELVEEISDLAEGNLTMHATVKSSITGAIADSINYTINALRKLVFTINETSVQVSTAAQEVQSTARQLAEASDNQAQEIVGATASINAMVASIEHVSNNAAKSSNVAEESVEIAKKGVEVVHDMIIGMSEIGRQIQETSKRIKRLGESSQEIGDTVSLIDDIADQTNILSLNAAIQAAMAGEAGRGFAVVADEVQRLAERSSHATKEIEALVKTIQGDTNQTVESMEQTTAEVVHGARLAEDAGVALEKIESVSSHLAELIQSISDEGQQQAATSSKISKNMEVIQNIAVQTASGTSNAANAIGTLAELVNDLRNSVAGFKLPVENDER